MEDRSGVNVPEKSGLGAAAGGLVLVWKGNELSGLDPVFDWSADQADQELVVVLENDQGCLTGETVGGQSYVPNGCPPSAEIASGALAHLGLRPVEITDGQIADDQPDLADVSAMVDARIDQIRNDAVDQKTDVIGSIVIGAGLAVTAISRVWRRYFRSENGGDGAVSAQPAPAPAPNPPAPASPPLRRRVVVGRPPNPGGGSQGSPTNNS